jgi:hypothetical protein
VRGSLGADDGAGTELRFEDFDANAIAVDANGLTLDVQGQRHDVIEQGWPIDSQANFLTFLQRLLATEQEAAARYIHNPRAAAANRTPLLVADLAGCG